LFLTQIAEIMSCNQTLNKTATAKFDTAAFSTNQPIGENIILECNDKTPHPQERGVFVANNLQPLYAVIDYI